MSETGERRRVDTGATARWEVLAKEARRRFSGEVDAAWARLVEGLSAAVNAAPPLSAPNPLTTLAERLRSAPVDPALERAGQRLRAAVASPELAQALSDVGARLQEVAQRLVLRTLKDLALELFSTRLGYTRFVAFQLRYYQRQRPALRRGCHQEALPSQRGTPRRVSQRALHVLIQGAVMGVHTITTEFMTQQLANHPPYDTARAH